MTGHDTAQPPAGRPLTDLVAGRLPGKARRGGLSHLGLLAGTAARGGLDVSGGHEPVGVSCRRWGGRGWSDPASVGSIDGSSTLPQTTKVRTKGRREPDARTRVREQRQQPWSLLCWGLVGSWEARRCLWRVVVEVCQGASKSSSWVGWSGSLLASSTNTRKAAQRVGVGWGRRSWGVWACLNSRCAAAPFSGSARRRQPG